MECVRIGVANVKNVIMMKEVVYTVPRCTALPTRGQKQGEEGGLVLKGVLVAALGAVEELAVVLRAVKGVWEGCEGG